MCATYLPSALFTLKNLGGTPMIEDPIVAEVRKYREEHATIFGHDLKRIVAALRERERKSERPVLNPGPKYLFRKTGG